jgi:serralysin
MAKRVQAKAVAKAPSQNGEGYLVPCIAPDLPSHPFVDGDIAFGVIEVTKTWPQNHVLTISFVDPFPNPTLEAKVQEITSEWAQHINLTFNFVGRDRNADVRISFSGQGHWSAIGTDSKDRRFFPQNSMNLQLRSNTQESELRRVILHEFGHALGLHHEHMHPKKGIPWNVPEVYRYFRAPPNNWNDQMIFNNVLKRVENDSRRFRWTEFDIDSIMCYYFPPQLTNGQIIFRHNTKLSPTDIEIIEQIYPPRKTLTPPVELILDGKSVTDEIGKPGEVDVFFFRVLNADGYVIETQGDTDVTIGLYGPDDDKKLIKEDMDTGLDWNARLAEYLQPGKYYVKVWHHLPTGKGKYKISVKTWQPS